MYILPLNPQYNCRFLADQKVVTPQETADQNAICNRSIKTMKQEHFGFKKVLAKEVIKQLNIWGRGEPKKLCVKHLKLYPKERSDLMATCEEKWTHHYT